MNLAENLSRDFPQVVGENITNEAKERWATDFKIVLQRRDVTLPRDRELVGEEQANDWRDQRCGSEPRLYNEAVCHDTAALGRRDSTFVPPSTLDALRTSIPKFVVRKDPP